MKSSTAVKLVLVGTPVFLSGCGCYVQPQPVMTATPVVAADGVPVITYAQPGYHFSPFYHGYVPIFIPIGGIGYGNTYQTFYNRVPESDRRRYATPTSSGRASAAPVPVTRTATATPTSNASVSKATPASTSTGSPNVTRGIAGSTGMGTGGSAS